jgi:3-hydroxyisobutyrate dehydrogenase-like beta-hydroxyacid dehydrogenase
MVDTKALRIGFIGLGAMGLPMAKCLARNIDCELRVFDVRAAVNAAAGAWGGKPCNSAVEVAQSSDVVITMLPDDAAVRAVALDDGGILAGCKRGSVFMDFSTIGPWTIREVGERFAASEVRVFSGAVTLGVKAAIEGKLAVYLDADAAADAVLSRIVRGFASTIIPIAGHGNAKVIKLINNLMVGVNVAATAEAVALAEKAGLPATKLVPLILKGSGSSYALANHIARSALDDDLGEGKFGVDYILKDMKLAMELAKRVNHTTFFGALGMSSYRGAKAMGFGANYYPIVLRWMEHAAAQPVSSKNSKTGSLSPDEDWNCGPGRHGRADDAQSRGRW